MVTNVGYHQRVEETLKELGDLVQASWTTVNRWENKQSQPSKLVQTHVLERLSDLKLKQHRGQISAERLSRAVSLCNVIATAISELSQLLKSI